MKKISEKDEQQDRVKPERMDHLEKGAKIGRSKEKGFGYGLRVSSKSTKLINNMILSNIPNWLNILKRKTLWKYNME
jgi:hypothetical protein